MAALVNPAAIVLLCLTIVAGSTPTWHAAFEDGATCLLQHAAGNKARSKAEQGKRQDIVAFRSNFSKGRFHIHHVQRHLSSVASPHQGPFCWGGDGGAISTKEALKRAAILGLAFILIFAIFVKESTKPYMLRHDSHRLAHFDKTGKPTEGKTQGWSPYCSPEDAESLRRWATGMRQHSELFRGGLQDAKMPKRTEKLYRFVPFYRESEEEVFHTLEAMVKWPQHAESIRLFVYLDGLQNAPSLDEEQGAAACETLSALSRLFPLGQPKASRGCALFEGQAGPAGVAFEIYVKGPQVPRTKWQSHVEFLAIVAAEVAETRHEPEVVMMGDGDCKVDFKSMDLMARYVRDNLHMGGVGPYLNGTRANTATSLHAAMRYWTQSVECRAMSALSFHYPLYGCFQVWSMKAIKAICSEYVNTLRYDSLWDNAQVLNGEDGFATVCCLSAGLGVQVLPNAFGEIFVPESPLDYVSQQCRWRLGECNSLDLIFNRQAAWRGWRLLLWPVRAVESTMMEAPFGAGVLTLSGSYVAEAFWSSLSPSLNLSLGAGVRPGMLLHGMLWACLAGYAMLAAGKPVKSAPRLNGSAMIFMVLLSIACSSMVIVLIFRSKICMFPWGLVAVNIWLLRPFSVWFAQLPHGQPWPYAVLISWYQGLLYWVDAVQAPLLAYANLEGSAGWGTRTKGEDAGQTFAETVLWKRRCLLAAWFSSNYALGALAFAAECSQIFLALVYFSNFIEQFCYLGLGLVHSLKSVWLTVQMKRSIAKA